VALNSNDRSIAAFTMLGHGLVHWFEMSIPIFLVVWRTDPGASVVLAGVVIALGYVPFGLGSLPGGLLADRFGPRRLILVCYGSMSVAFLVLSLADSMLTITLALILWGIAASVYHPAGNSLISTGATHRGTVFAYHGIAGNVGIALGPFTTATLLVFFDWQLVAALLAIPGLFAVLYGLRLDFDPTAATEAEGSVEAGTPLTVPTFLANSKRLFASAFVLVFALVMFEGLFYRGLLTFLPEILHGLPAMEDVEFTAGLRGFAPADYVFVGLLVVGMVGQYVGGKLTDRISVERGLVALFLILAVLALAFVPVSALGLGPLLAYCVLLGFFLFAIQPFYQVAVALHTPADTRGLSYGYTFLAEFGFGATSVALSGFVLGSFSLAAYFAVLAGFALVAAAFSLVLLLGRGRFEFMTRSNPDTAD
jgi:MFS family permease